MEFEVATGFCGAGTAVSPGIVEYCVKLPAFQINPAARTTNKATGTAIRTPVLLKKLLSLSQKETGVSIRSRMRFQAAGEG